MRVGVVTTSYPRAPGDPAGNFVAGFAHYLARRGHTVEIVAAGPGNDRDGDLPVHRVTLGAGLFFDQGAPDKLESDYSLFFHAPLFTAALLAETRRHRWDRVVSHWLVPSGLVAATLGIPHLAIAHSADVHLAARPLLADAVAATLARSRIVFVAEHLRQRLLRAIRMGRLRQNVSDHSLTFPMGIDLPAPRDRAAARARFGLAAAERTVVFLGRRVPIKGLDVLSAAMRQLPGVTLLVAGDGPETASGRLLGELRGEARDDLLAAADVVVIPSRPQGSRTEGAPMVLVEALAAGAPVVASDLPGIRETAGGAARLVPPGDATALARAIRAVLDQPPDPSPGRVVAARRSWDVVGPLLHDALMTV